MVMFKKPTILLNFLAFHTHKTIGNIAIFKHIATHCDKSIHNCNAHSNGSFTSKDCRKHSNSLFRKYIGQILTSSPSFLF